MPSSSHWQTHAWRNRIQSVLLVVFLLALAAWMGQLMFGPAGRWFALWAAVAALIADPTVGGRLTLAAFRAVPLQPQEAPGLRTMVDFLATRAGLPRSPRLYLIPSSIANAFAVGSRRNPAIAVTEGLLVSLQARELAGILAHETAHIASGDTRVMGLADAASRVTSILSLAGQVLVIFSLPTMLLVPVDVNWLALATLVFAPHFSLLAQLGLSRVREYDADLNAARLTGDAEGLALALAKLDAAEKSWRRWLLPGWGRPEPSALRTHPPTHLRIKKLLAEKVPPLRQNWGTASGWQTGKPLEPRRWFPGGLWR